ncbi:MAG: hypothetical protein JWR26_3660 [Pedosphaera sp.]|nr:hypothetical protein [Pedosphaera sp.]
MGSALNAHTPPIPPCHITAPFLKATQPARRSHEHSSCRPLLEYLGFFWCVFFVCLRTATMGEGRGPLQPSVAQKPRVRDPATLRAARDTLQEWLMILAKERALCRRKRSFSKAGAPGGGTRPTVPEQRGLLTVTAQNAALRSKLRRRIYLGVGTGEAGMTRWNTSLGFQWTSLMTGWGWVCWKVSNMATARTAQPGGLG